MSSKIILPNEFLSLAEDELLNGRSVKLLADGASMYPFIHGGEDISEIEPIASASPLLLWHVYMFKHNGKYVIHRYVGKKEGNFIMEGDSNLNIREIVERRNVIGHLRYIHKNNGKTIDCSDKSWINRGKIWGKLKPGRKYLLALVRRLYKYKLISR